MAFFSSMMPVLKSPLASKSLARWMCSCSVSLAVWSQPDRLAEARARAMASATGCFVIFRTPIQARSGAAGRAVGLACAALKLLEQVVGFLLVPKRRVAREQPLQFIARARMLAAFRERCSQVPLDLGGVGHLGQGLLQKLDAAFRLSL